MKPAREPASSRPKPCASLKKADESCPFAAPCWPSQVENRPWSEISFSLKNLPVRAFYFGLAKWVQPFPRALPCPSLIPGANPVLTRRLLSSLPRFAGVRQFWCCDRWYGRSGLLWIQLAVQATNDIEFAVVGWSQHVWISYHLITFTVWVHPGRMTVSVRIND